jgi:hypothetical protein
MTKPDVARSPDAGRSRGTVSNQSGNLPAMTRVDAPHEAMDSAREVTADEAMPAAMLVPDESVCEQIGLQTAQLATHFRNRQQELDHREAELNSRIARLESDARAARLWLDQHEADMAARGEAWSQRHRELDARTEAAATNEEEFAQRSNRLSEREVELAERERDVERRLARLATVEASQQRRVSVSDIERAEELQRAAEALDRRRHWLDEEERRLAASQSEARELCEQLVADHRNFAEQAAALRAQIAADRGQAMAEIEEKRQAVQRRARHVDECSAALRQLRAELGRMHQETLEIRLATEELWAQLSGAAPPAALTQSLGRIRAKLAEQQRQAQAETTGQKKELEVIRSVVAAEREKLAEQKRQFERWVAGCQEDCRQQASRLVAREQELRDREIQIRQQAQRWQAERLRYQIELRRLQSHAGTEAEAAALATC